MIIKLYKKNWYSKPDSVTVGFAFQDPVGNVFRTDMAIKLGGFSSKQSSSVPDFEIGIRKDA